MQAKPYFLMTRTNAPLFLALAISLCLHALPLLPTVFSRPEKPSTAPPMTATLRPPASSAAPVPLHLPEPPKAGDQAATPQPAKPLPRTTSTATARTWTQVVRQHLEKLQKDGLFYPPEAIERGLQGEVLVLVILDAGGQVVGARVEQGSGHPILDNAALNAVRSLRALPDDAPRETLLPVRFRLR